MYNQPPTLPSITTVGNGIEYSSSNGDIARIKQEKDVVHHSLPPIRAMNNDNCNNNSIMSINQLCNDPDDEMKKAAAVLENMKQTALPPIEVTQLSSTHEGSIASPNSDGLIARLGELPFLRRTKTAYEQVSTSTTSPAPFPSRWQQMLVGAGAAVGTARAVVNEESMKSLRYCLEWLQYATQSIEHQITVLRDLIVKLTTPSSDSALVHSNASTTLSTIKKNIVDNLRKVIDIVSRYASKCLPDQAKQNVRSFILSLPTRWATINHSDLSASLSPLSSPQLNPINAHPNHQTADYAHRLLSLATESLDMLLRVKGTFGESVERAEAWLERLKAIPPVGWSSQPATTNDYSYGQSSSTLHSPPSFRPRKSSNSSRVSNRKYNRTIPVDDDDESIINNYDSDDSDDSEVENKRMEDNRSNRSQNSSKSPSPHGGVNGRRRKKVAKKDDRMDLSEPF